MSITHQVLGQPGRDNALYAEVDTGQAIHRLLFDCGDGCLDGLAVAQIRAIDAVFFSHFHIDHIAGFDTLLRCTFCREESPVRIFGPAGTCEIIQHRLRGILWNLVEGLPGEYLVHEVGPKEITTHRFLTSEGFAVAHPCGNQEFDGVVMDNHDFAVHARLMDHGITSMAYCVREKPRNNVDTKALEALGLRPGPWLKLLKDPSVADETELLVDETAYHAGHLREKLLVSSSGDSIAYLTDFQVDSSSEKALLAMIRECGVVVCENNFHDDDLDLAVRSFHMVSSDVGRIAANAGIGKLILFHLSDRYTADVWHQQLQAVQSVFPNACFPEQWELS